MKELVKETQVLPAEMPPMMNKGLQTKPFMVSKSTSAKPVGVNQSTQTDAPVQPTIIPLPVPINIPTPCKMYNAPFPVPVPIPLPFPVPIFIPTTRNSMKGIMKQIKKIQNKIPADPFEAELLALAGNMADEDKDSDSEEDVGKNMCCVFRVTLFSELLLQHWGSCSARIRIIVMAARDRSAAVLYSVTVLSEATSPPRI